LRAGFVCRTHVFQRLKGPAVVTSRTSIRSLLAVAALGLASLITGCGGGGAVTPSCADTNVVTISSGVGPFQVFTSDATVLPVTQVVPGAAITLVPSNVDADRSVTLTVRDAAGQTVNVAVTVKATPLIGAMTVTPANASLCGALGVPIGTVAMCSGETASASLTLKGANALPIANRQVRFDVIQGPYSFALDRDATLFAKTITVLTDQNGQAIVTIRSDAGVPTQVSLIRGTDITSGNRVDASFTIIQTTSGTPAFSVSPIKNSISGYYVNQCGLGSASYQIYGGTAPYTVFSNSISFVVLEVGSTRGQSVVVSKSGGTFDAVALGGACTGTSTAIFTITDATGRVITASFDAVAGTVALPVAPAPNDLVVTPPDARIVCSDRAVVVFTISGGTQPYTIATDRPYVPLVSETNPSNGTTVTGSSVRLNQTFAAGSVINVAIADAKSKTIAAKISCIAPLSSALSMSQVSATAVATSGFCNAASFAAVPIIVGAGTGPYTASLNVSGTVASTTVTNNTSANTATVTVVPANATSVAAGTTILVSAFDSLGGNGTATVRCQ
jgi:hypothetical protein